MKRLVLLAVLAACGAPAVDDGPDAAQLDAPPAPIAGPAPGCAPTAPGQPGIVWIPGPLHAMEHDPTRCLLYAITSAAPDESQLVVIDTAAKRELARVDLGHPARDLAVAADGSRIGIAHGDGVGEITVITPPMWDSLQRVTTAADDVDALAMTSDGRAYYYATAAIWELDLATGASIRRRSAIASPTAQLALAPGESSLWVASVGASPGSLKRLAIAADGTMTIADQSEHLLLADLGFGGDLALSADGTRVAYAGFIFDTADLSIVHGGMAATIFALDAAGRFGLHDRGVFDAELVRTVRTYPGTWDAVLTPSDDEVWRYEPLTDLMHFENVADLVTPATLGQRAWAPLPMAAYHFDHLLADPTRAWLYGLDASRGELVVLDRATLAPVQAILVGTAATGLALDPSGDQLLVGHHYTWGLARIDLDTLAFDGYLWTHQFADQVVPLRPGRVAVLGGYSSRAVRLMDLASGATLDLGNGSYREATAVASPDGMHLRVGEAGTSASSLIVIDTTGDQLVELRELPFSSSPEVFYPTKVTAVPGSADVFWARGRWNTDTLTRTFALTPLVHTVTSGGLAISADQVFDAATGAPRGALPASSAAQALSPDEQTLYLGLDGAVETVDLSTF